MKHRQRKLARDPRRQSSPGGKSWDISSDNIDNFRQKIYSIIHCEKPVMSLYEGLSPGGINRISPNYTNTINTSTLVATSASIHVKPKVKQIPKIPEKTTSNSTNGKAKAMRTDHDEIFNFWQKHYSFYFPEFGNKEESPGPIESMAPETNNLPLISPKSNGKCIVRTIPKLGTTGMMKTSYFPTVEFVNTFPRKEAVQLKGKIGNSNSAEIKIDLSAKCRLNNDGKNMLSYRAYDGWEIAIPFTPSPITTDAVHKATSEMESKYIEKSVDHTCSGTEAIRDSENPFITQSSESRASDPDARNSVSSQDSNFAIDTVLKINSM